MGVHDGHRQRMRERVRREGLLNLEPHNVLELLLFNIFPRGDTNELAHRILDYFHGDFAAMADASYEELLKIEGVGERTAFMLTQIPQLSAYYRQARIRNGITLDSMEALRDYFIPIFYGKNTEEMYVVCLDGGLHPIHRERISTGSSTATGVNIKRVIEIALGQRCMRVMLVHNHPSGVARPSQRDVQATREAAVGLKLVEVELTDHIIVSGEGLCSMRSTGFMSD